MGKHLLKHSKTKEIADLQSQLTSRSNHISSLEEAVESKKQEINRLLNSEKKLKSKIDQLNVTDASKPAGKPIKRKMISEDGERFKKPKILEDVEGCLFSRTFDVIFPLHIERPLCITYDWPIVPYNPPRSIVENICLGDMDVTESLLKRRVPSDPVTYNNKIKRFRVSLANRPVCSSRY